MRKKASAKIGKSKKVAKIEDLQATPVKGGMAAAVKGGIYQTVKLTDATISK